VKKHLIDKLSMGDLVGLLNFRYKKIDPEVDFLECESVVFD
jgi:hypothetical protein|tara:strand:- start:3493 stop:3615 length:123 start_codon:yes stop_codon:yes gene_type:complete